MNEQIRAAARRTASRAPRLSPEQRLRLAVLLRPDLPVGIKRSKATKEAA